MVIASITFCWQRYRNVLGWALSFKWRGDSCVGNPFFSRDKTQPNAHCSYRNTVCLPLCVWCPSRHYLLLAIISLHSQSLRVKNKVTKTKIFLSRIFSLLEFTVQLQSCADVCDLREEVKGHQQQEGVGQTASVGNGSNYGFISSSGLWASLLVVCLVSGVTHRYNVWCYNLHYFDY